MKKEGSIRLPVPAMEICDVVWRCYFMKRFERFAALLLASAMLMSVFAGCGDKTDGSSSGKASQASKGETTSSSKAADPASADTGETDTSKEVELSMYVVSDRQ